MILPRNFAGIDRLLVLTGGLGLAVVGDGVGEGVGVAVG